MTELEKRLLKECKMLKDTISHLQPLVEKKNQVIGYFNWVIHHAARIEMCEGGFKLEWHSSTGNIQRVGPYSTVAKTVNRAIEWEAGWETSDRPKIPQVDILH